MHKFLPLIFLALALCTSCSGMQREPHPTRTLFVGNSLTYVGNLPAVFSALSSANGRTVTGDMIVRGGATLSQRVANGSATDAPGSFLPEQYLLGDDRQP